MVSISDIKNMLENNVDLVCGRLSICNMKKYTKNNVIKRTGIQVHSEYGKSHFSQIFELDNIDLAVRKFLELKNVYCDRG